MAEVVLTLKMNPALDVAKVNVMIDALKRSLGPLGKEIQPLNAEQLRKKLSEIPKEIVTAETEMKRLNETLKKGHGTAEQFGKAFAFNQLIGAVQHAAREVQHLTQPYIELDTQVRNIGTLGVENFERFADVSKRLAMDVPESAAAIASGIYEAISAGIAPEAAEEFVRNASRAAVAGLTDTRTAVDVLTTSVNSFRKDGLDAARAADVMFQAVALGKTTFPQLAASMSQAASFSAEMGVSFESLNAAVATMTKNGVPTAEAMTRISASLTSLAKGSTEEMDQLLQRLNVASGKELITRFGSLQGAFVALREAAGGDEGFLIKAFGRVEGFKALLSLTGSNATEAASDLLSIENSAGRAAEAYEVAAGSIANQSDRMTKVIQNAVKSVFTALGDTTIAATNSLAQLAPTFAALSGIKHVIPESAIKATHNGLKNLMLQVGKIAPGMTVAAEGGKVAMASFGKASIAFMTSPIGIAIAAIGGLVAAVAILNDALTTTNQERLEEVEASLKLNELQTKEAQQNRKRAESTNSLSKEYILLAEKLKHVADGSQEAAQTKQRLEAITEQLAQRYPGVIKRTEDFSTTLGKVRDIASDTSKEIGTLSETLKGLQESKLKEEELKLQVELDIEQEKVKEGLESVFDKELAVTTGNIFTDLAVKAGTAFGKEMAGAISGSDVFKDFSDKLKAAASEKEVADVLGDLNKKLNDAKVTGQQRLDIQKAINAAGDLRIKQLEREKSAQQAVNEIVQAPELGQTLADDVAALQKELEDLQKKRNQLRGDEQKKIRESAAIAKEEEKVQKRIDALMGKQRDTGKSAYELASKRFNTDRQRLEDEQRTNELSQDAWLLQLKREETSLDDLAIEETKLDNLERQIEAFREAYKIGKNGAIGINVKPEEAEQIRIALRKLEGDVEEQQNKIGGIRMKVDFDAESFKEEKRKLTLDKLEFEVSIGIAQRSALLNELNNDLVKLSEKRQKASGKEQQELERREFELARKINGVRTDLFNDNMRLLERSQRREEEAIQKSVALQDRFVSAIRAMGEGIGSRFIDQQTAQRKDALERQKRELLKGVENNESERERIERDFAERSDQIERQAASRKAQLQAQIRGQELAQQTAHEAQALTRERASLQQRLKLAEESNQFDVALQLREQLEDVEATLLEKKDTVGTIMNEFASGFGESMTALFDGDPEAMKESMRVTLSTISGFILRLAEAAVVELTLGSTPLKTLASTFGFAAPVVLAGFMATIRATLRSTLGPLLASITSFGTGGRVDEPTLAVVGDAGRYTSSGMNTEWIFRDRDIKALIRATIEELVHHQTALLEQIVKELRVLQNERTVLRGDDIKLAYDRNTAFKQSRVRS